MSCECRHCLSSRGRRVNGLMPSRFHHGWIPSATSSKAAQVSASLPEIVDAKMVRMAEEVFRWAAAAPAYPAHLAGVVILELSFLRTHQLQRPQRLQQPPLALALEHSKWQDRHQPYESLSSIWREPQPQPRQALGNGPRASKSPENQGACPNGVRVLSPQNVLPWARHACTLSSVAPPPPRLPKDLCSSVLRGTIHRLRQSSAPAGDIRGRTTQSIAIREGRPGLRSSLHRCIQASIPLQVPASAFSSPPSIGSHAPVENGLVLVRRTRPFQKHMCQPARLLTTTPV